MSSPAFESAAEHSPQLLPTLETTSLSTALLVPVGRPVSALAPYLGAPPISQPPYDQAAREPRGPTAIAIRSRTQQRAQILPGGRTAASPSLGLVRPAGQERSPVPGPSADQVRAPVTVRPTDQVPSADRAHAAGQVHFPGQPSEIREANVPGWSREADSGVTLTTARDLPPSRTASHLLARAVIEVISGYRQLAQLRIHCAPEVFAGIGKHIRVGGPPSKLTSVHASEPADGIVEACAVFRRGHRVAALAFRLQGVDGRWRITALQIG